MFASWGSLTYRLRRIILAVLAVAVVGSGIWGLGVFGELTEGGYIDPEQRVLAGRGDRRGRARAAGRRSGRHLHPTTAGLDDPAAGRADRREAGGAAQAGGRRGQPRTGRPRRRSWCGQGRSSAWRCSPWPATRRRQARQRTGRSTTTSPSTGAHRDRRRPAAGPVAPRTAPRPTWARPSSISLPIVLLLLLFIFGSLVAASLPVLVGGSAVLGSLGMLHAGRARHRGQLVRGQRGQPARARHGDRLRAVHGGAVPGGAGRRPGHREPSAAPSPPPGVPSSSPPPC